jgi:hypothetical protein
MYRCNAANSGIKEPGTPPHASVKADQLDVEIKAHILPALSHRLERGDSLEDDASVTVRDLLMRRTQLQRRRTNLDELIEADGLTSSRRASLTEIRDELAQVETDLTDARAAGTAGMHAIARALHEAGLERAAEAARTGAFDGLGTLLDVSAAADAFQAYWSGMSLEEKRDLVRALLEVEIHPASRRKYTLTQVLDGEAPDERIRITYK